MNNSNENVRSDSAYKAALMTAVAAVSAKPYLAESSPVTQNTDLDILYTSAVKLAGMVKDRKVSSRELTELCIKRIQEVNPKINAVVTPAFERALQEADEADRMLARGSIAGPLHGVPMTIKDSIDTEGIVSTGGTQGRSHFVPENDATVVARLRMSGAIVLGKTNTPEFTLGGVSGLGTTSNILFGMTKNPYNTRYSVYGSSGGAGAIVAAGGSPFDIGSDFGGSIRSPSHACGIAGIKPTTGRVPRTGHIVGYGGTFDSYQQLGPMARYVEDIELILPLISGPDGSDAIIYDIPYGKSSEINLKTLRICYYTQQGKGAAGATSEVAEVIDNAVGVFRKLGCSVSEAVPPRIMEAMEIRSILRNADGNTWQKRLTEKYGTLVPGPSRKFDYPKLPADEFYRLLAVQDDIKSEILQFMEGYDLIICPVRSTPVPEIGDPNDYQSIPGTSFTSIYNVTGYPAGVVRGGTCESGLPIGVQVVSAPWREDIVLAAMTLLEKELTGFVRPAI